MSRPSRFNCNPPPPTKCPDDIKAKCDLTIVKDIRPRPCYPNDPLGCPVLFGPVQGRMILPGQDKTEVVRQLMKESRSEYPRYCKPVAPVPEKPGSDLFVLGVEPDICHECMRDPTIPMLPPPEAVKDMIFEGLAKEGGGYYRYLQTRYESPPEVRFCYPPTTNSEYAWRLKEQIRLNAAATKPRLETVGPAYNPSQKYLCHADYAPYHFPRIY